MDKKLTIKEIEMPYVLVGDDERRYELLCEFQDKDRAFQRVYVQEAGEDVIILAKHIGASQGPGNVSSNFANSKTIENDNVAIVGMFSVEEGKVSALFDYIEATTDGKEWFVCWLSGEFEQLLEQASKEGGKYPLIRNGIGIDDRVSLFYRQRRLDSITSRAIEGHTVSVDFVELEGPSDELDDEMFFSEPELDEVFDAQPKVTQAGLLPEGWNWVDYGDGSGHLEEPDGKKWFLYDLHHDAYVEFRRDEDCTWRSYPGRFDDFKYKAEMTILEKYLGIDRSLIGMNKLKFYVIEDMHQGFDCVYFEDVASALERFQEAKADTSKFPALGVRIGDGSMDLLHSVCGEAVLVPDYRDMSNFSEPMKAAEENIREVVRWLIEEKWCAGFEYQSSILPAWGYSDVKVLVPATIGNEPKNSYCNDKILKTTLSSGIDAIDSLYIENHGWVAYNELLKNTKEYAPEGFIKVQQLNVVYVREKNIVGIDGWMDIAPHDFSTMVGQINKPYSVVAYDKQDYFLQYKDKHEFIIASYETASEAIKGMSDIRERTGNIPLIVQSRDSGHLISSYNGKNVKDVLDAAFEAANEHNASNDIKAKTNQERELN